VYEPSPRRQHTASPYTAARIATGLIEVEDTPADQFPKDLEGLFVGFMPKSMPNFAPDIGRDPSVNGRFQAPVYAGQTYDVKFARLPDSYYVKRLVYNGIEQPDVERFTTSPGVLDHSVRLVLSKKAATFQARVDPDNTVVLVRDGLDAARRYSERVVLTPGQQQQGVMRRGLRPGPYRAFLIPTAALSSLELPGGIDQALLNAQAVQLEEGQTTAVSFKP
jgi:hypothetical protein